MKTVRYNTWTHRLLCSMLALCSLALPAASREACAQFEEEHTIKVLIVSLKGCGPCNRMKSEIATLKKRLEQKGYNNISNNIEQIYNVEAEMQSKYKVDVSRYPTILIIVDGKLHTTFVGFRAAQELLTTIMDIIESL